MLVVWKADILNWWYTKVFIQLFSGPRYKNLQDHTQNVYNDQVTLYHSGCYWHINSLQGGAWWILLHGSQICRLPCPNYKRVHEGCKIAYTNTAKEHPSFGFAEKIPNIVWWKTCVRDSFVKVIISPYFLDLLAC